MVWLIFLYDFDHENVKSIRIHNVDKSIKDKMNLFVWNFVLRKMGSQRRCLQIQKGSCSFSLSRSGKSALKKRV